MAAGCAALVVLLLGASAVAAAPSPVVPSLAAAARSCPVPGAESQAALFGEGLGVDAPRATPVDSTGTCGPRMYSCRQCTDGTQLCYEQICGNYVIVNCDPCAPECVLPPG
jgi:hypothetical protein